MLNLQSFELLKKEDKIAGVILNFKNTIASFEFFRWYLRNFCHGCIVINEQGVTFNLKRGEGFDELKKFDLSGQLSLEELRPLIKLIQEKQMVWNLDQSGELTVLTGRDIRFT